MFTTNNNFLEATLKFDTFVQAFAYMTEAAFHIEQHNHHPEWSNVYNIVNIRLNTHDADHTITDKDHNLAKVLTKLYQKYQ